MTGDTTQRGYGWQHQRLRKAAEMSVNAGGVLCCRCGKPVLPGSDWHLDHSDTDRSKYIGVSHAKCNISAGARNRGRNNGRNNGYNNGDMWALPAPHGRRDDGSPWPSAHSTGLTILKEMGYEMDERGVWISGPAL